MISDEDVEKLAREYADDCEIPVTGGPRRNQEIGFEAGFRACEKMMAEKFPSELNANEEVWKRITKHEDRKAPSGLPEYIIKDVTADAYWMACYNWLKQKLLGDK
jgi:hypothetical protein